MLFRSSSGFPETDVRRAAQAMQEGMSGTELRFQLYNQEGRELYDSGAEEILRDSQREVLFSAASGETGARMMVRTGEGFGLATVSTVLMEDGTLLYLETDRDVTALFADRESQYGIYRRWMAGLLLLQGLGCYLIAVWLLRPLGRLSRASRRIAGGNLEVRAKVETGDEIGQLAEEFNQMADNLEKQCKEREDAAEEERFTAANYIFREGKRLEALSFKLLDLMVIRHGALQKRSVNARWLAEEIQGVLKPALEKAGIALQVLVEEKQILVEPDLMKTVLLNLMDNGRKAMEDGGRMYLLGRTEQQGFSFYVQDTGKGMPEEELSRITEAFYMVDKSRARRQGGAGLGLSICAEIVKKHGGDLSFQSIQGKGTLARVWLPS